MAKKNTHIAYGFVTGIVMIIISVILYKAGVALKPGMEYVALIPFLIGTILYAMAFSKEMDGFVTFGNVFGKCFKMSMIVALMMAAWGIVTIYIFPELKEKVLEMMRTEMAKNPKVTEDQIETTVKAIGKFWNVIVIGGALLRTLFYGAIFSLIGAAVAKKKGAAPIQDM